MIDKLHYISQENESHSQLALIEQALIAGCKWIQLRIKNQALPTVLVQAKLARELCDKHGAKLIINDYPKIARACAADGLHLGLDDGSILEARKMLGPQIIIGGTANTFDNICRHVQDGADYVGLGPFRYTSTKAKLSPILGLSGFQKIMEQLNIAGITIPVIAIGGLVPTDIPALINIGLHGLAISGAITYASKREIMVADIYNKLHVAQAYALKKNDDVNYSG